MDDDSCKQIDMCLVGSRKNKVLLPSFPNIVLTWAHSPGTSYLVSISGPKSRFRRTDWKIQRYLFTGRVRRVDLLRWESDAYFLKHKVAFISHGIILLLIKLPATSNSGRKVPESKTDAKTNITLEFYIVSPEYLQNKFHLSEITDPLGCNSSRYLNALLAALH